MSITTKLKFGDDLRRITISRNTTFQKLQEIAATRFNIPKQKVVFKKQGGESVTSSQIEQTIKLGNKLYLEVEEADDLYDFDEPEIDITQGMQNTPASQPQQNQKPQVVNPPMPPIFSALFGGMRPQNQQQAAPQNPMGSILSFLPMLGGMFGGNNSNPTAMGDNLKLLAKLVFENLSKQEIEEILVAVYDSIPQEQLQGILLKVLSNPGVQKVIVSKLLGSLNSISEKHKKKSSTNQGDNASTQPEQPAPQSNNNEELDEEIEKQIEILRKKQLLEDEEMSKNEREKIELLKKQIEEEKKMKEEKAKRELERLAELEKMKAEEERMRAEEERMRAEQEMKELQRIKEEEEKKKELQRMEEERLQREIELKKKMEMELKKKKKEMEEAERKRIEEERLRQQEEQRKELQALAQRRLEEQRELQRQQMEAKRIEQERIRREQEEQERKRKEQEEQERKRKEQEEQQKKNKLEQKAINILAQKNISYHALTSLREMGIATDENLIKVAKLLVKYRGDANAVADALFNN